MDIAINYYAVLASGVLTVVLGMLWYGPLFGKVFLKETGTTPEQVAAYRKDPAAMRAMNRSYVIVAIFGFIMSFVLAHVIALVAAYTQMNGPLTGITTGLWVWLGFIVPVTLNSVLWEGKSKQYWLVVAGYYFVALALMGAVLSLWV